MMNSLFRIATHDPSSMFQADEVVDQFPDRRIYVGARDGDSMKNLIVFEIDERGIPSKVVFAKTGTLTSDEEHQRLLLRVKDAHFEQRDARQPDNVELIQQGITMREGVFPMSLKKLIDRKKRDKPLTSHTLGELMAELAQPDCHRKETSVGFALSLVIAFSYFFFILIAEALSKNPAMPAGLPVFMIWLPNFLFMGLGVWLFSRLAKR